MKFLFFFSFIAFFLVKETSASTFSVNQEIFKCGDVIEFPLRKEAEEQFYKFNKLDLNSLDGPESLITSLAEVSPSRASVLQFLSSVSKRVKFVSGSELRRSSPSAVLVQPSDCSVEVLSELSFTQNEGSVLIQKDYFDKLSAVDKLYFWLQLTADYIQAMHVLSFQEEDFNLLSGKEFAACWFSSDCRPKSVSDMHKLVQDRDLGLLYYEQDHHFIPQNDLVSFHENGFLQTFQKHYKLSVIDPELREFFHPFVKVEGQKLSVDSQKTFSRPKSIFLADGTIGCAYPTEGQGPDRKLAPLKFNVFSEDSEWISSPIFQFDFPLCWSSDKKIIQGFYLDRSKEGLHLQFSGHDLVIDKTYSYSLDKLRGSGFYFYPDGALKWMTNAKGKVALGNEDYNVRGISVFYPDGKLRCAQFSESVSFTSDDGPDYHCHISGNQTCSLACFDEQGEFTGAPSDVFDMNYLSEDLSL